MQLLDAEKTVGDHSLAFTPTQHTHPTPLTAPSAVRLPPNHTVCILGASRGIGASIAHAYAHAGAAVLILAARDTNALSTVAAQCRKLHPPVTVHCEPCDIVSAGSVAALAARIRGRWGGLDVVVVNSGFAGPSIARVTEGDPEDWRRCFEVNTVGTYHAAHHLLPLLLLGPPGGGRSFVVVSASAAWITEGVIANSGYCVSKLAQLRLVEMMAGQYRGEGLLSVGVHPGAVETEMAKSAPEEFRKYLTDSVELCGAFCVWLTKDAREKLWLSGRFVSATWDTEELTARKDEILEKDLLKARIAMS